MACSMAFSQKCWNWYCNSAAKLDVKSTSNYVGQFNGAAPMYMGILKRMFTEATGVPILEIRKMLILEQGQEIPRQTTFYHSTKSEINN
jgi:hypothetical protein